MPAPSKHAKWILNRTSRTFTTVKILSYYPTTTSDVDYYYYILYGTGTNNTLLTTSTRTPTHKHQTYDSLIFASGLKTTFIPAYGTTRYFVWLMLMYIYVCSYLIISLSKLRIQCIIQSNVISSLTSRSTLLGIGLSNFTPLCSVLGFSHLAPARGVAHIITPPGL